MSKSIKISVDGIVKEYGIEPLGSMNRIDYAPTDEDLEKIAGMINSGVAQDSVLITDESTGKKYSVYVKNGKLMMDESEG